MLELTPAGLVIRSVTPMGYCDHFGLRKFAEAEALGDRLADSLKIGGGTLVVSWLNLGERNTRPSPPARRGCRLSDCWSASCPRSSP